MNTALTWIAFECDGVAFDYLVIPSKQKERPPRWPAYKASPGPWMPIVVLEIRRRGQERGPAAMTYPEGTVITTARAVDAARLMWEALMR